MIRTIRNSYLSKIAALVLLTGAVVLPVTSLAIAPAWAATETLEATLGSKILQADLVVPDEAPAAGMPLVILVHGTLAHKDMELIETLQALMAERGIPSLAPTLSLNVDRREGFYDCAIPSTHRWEHAIAEILRWVTVAKSRGYQRIVLAGHSRGGMQAAAYLAGEPDPDVIAGVLIAPATGGKPVPADLVETVARAQALVDANQDNTIIDVPRLLYCKDTKAAAISVLSYHAPNPRRNTPVLMADISVPLLVIAAGNDEVVPDVVEKIGPIAEARDQVSLEIVEDSGHLFLDFYAEDAADLISDFLESLR